MNKFFIRLFFVVLVIITALIVLLEFLNKEAKPFDASIYPPYTGKSVSYILIDGLDKTRFNNLLSEGRLSNIEKFKREGLYVENGIGSFPSMTGYAFYPFLTGVDAVNSGILGLRWFDRSRNFGQFRNYVGRTNIHMNEDLDKKYKTLFQHFDSYYTASVNSYMTKGVKDEVKTGWALTTSKYQDLWLFKFFNWLPYFGERITYSHYQHETQVQRKASDQLEHNPAAQWITFATPDAYAHINGMDEEYDNIVAHIDSLIGQLVSKSKELGQERYFAILTDHGLEDVRTNIQVVDKSKEDIGLKLKRGDSTNLLFSAMDEDSDEELLDGYFVINGNLLSYIYFHENDINSWKKNLTEKDLSDYTMINGQSVNLIDYYRNQDYVDMVFYKIDDNSVGIATSEGRAKIINSGEYYAYNINTVDVFDYRSDSLSSTVISGYYNKQKWLAATKNSKYPFAPCRVYDLMSQASVGDLVLCSAEHVDFAKDYEILVGNYKGGHGGLRASMLQVPYIIYGNDLPAIEIDCALSEDIGTTIMELLAVDNMNEYDGINLLDSVLQIQTQDLME